MVQKTKFISLEKWIWMRKGWHNVFRKNYDSRFLLVQVYVDDIIFYATNEMLCEDFSKLM